MTDRYLNRPLDPGDPDLVSSLDELSFWSSRFGAFLFDHLELQRGARILDVGCGAGFPLFELAHRHGLTCRVIGIDIWKQSLRRALDKRGVYGLSNVLLVQADGAGLPLPDASCDLIVSNLGLNNFERPDRAILEWGRVSRPGGRLVLTTNPCGHMKEFYEAYQATLEDLNMSENLSKLTTQENHRASKELVCLWVEEAGFRVRKLRESSFQLRYLDGSALLEHFLTRVGFLDGWRSVVDRADERRVFAGLEKRLNDLAQEQGHLIMTVPMLLVEGVRQNDPS
jgi:ubiquinone/menaquinone biosynthesis C-methylase UbiE